MREVRRLSEREPDSSTEIDETADRQRVCPKCWISATLLLMLGLAILAGSAAATSLNHPQDQALANRLTFHLTDMATGWRVEPPSKSSGSCKAIKSVKSATTAEAETDFSSSPDLASSVVGVLSTHAISKRTYTNIVSNLRSCMVELLAKLVLSSNAKNPSIGEMSFPHFGDQSKAWSLQVTIQGVNVYIDIIVVRIQRAIAIYLFGGIGSGDSYQEVKLVRKATARA